MNCLMVVGIRGVEIYIVVEVGTVAAVLECCITRNSWGMIGIIGLLGGGVLALLARESVRRN